MFTRPAHFDYPLDIKLQGIKPEEVIMIGDSVIIHPVY